MATKKKPVKYATPEKVEAAVESWSFSQVDCRLYGHNWRSLSVIHHKGGDYTVSQRCVRCRNTRQQMVDYKGYPLGTWSIQYREGYLLKDLGRVGADGKAYLRLTSILNLPITEE